MFGKKKRNKVLVLIDFDNLSINFQMKPIIEELEKTLKQISKEVGAILKVFVFIPYHSALPFAESFYKAGFFTVLCPKVKTKDVQVEIDTTDKTLIQLGNELLEDIPGITHLCLGSGDADFLPLLRKASRYGLDISIIAGDEISLSSEIAEMADKKPNNKEKMIYILSSFKKEE